MPRPASAWSDLLLTGHAAIDDTHREFAQLIGALRGATAPAAAALLQQVREHCEEHFAAEEALMQTSEYPSMQCHAEEHAAVLASVRQVKAWWGDGRDIATVWRLGEALEAWFSAHTMYLDSALAHWVVSHRYGGAPVVVRRAGATQHAA